MSGSRDDLAAEYRRVLASGLPTASYTQLDLATSLLVKSMWQTHDTNISDESRIASDAAALRRIFGPFGGVTAYTPAPEPPPTVPAF